jgi:hypothetical protein
MIWSGKRYLALSATEYEHEHSIEMQDCYSLFMLLDVLQ